MLLQQVRQVLAAPPAIQSQPDTGGKGTDQTGSPEHQRANLYALPRKPNPPNPSAEAYLPTSGGPGGLTCGDMALAGEKQASVPCRPSMAARGGRVGMGPPGCQSGGRAAAGREEEEEDRMERGGVFLSRRLVFFCRCGGMWQHPFLGKSRQNPAPGTTGCPAGGIPPLLRRVYEWTPCRPGHLQDTHRPTCRVLHYRFYLDIHHNKAGPVWFGILGI